MTTTDLGDRPLRRLWRCRVTAAAATWLTLACYLAAHLYALASLQSWSGTAPRMAMIVAAKACLFLLVALGAPYTPMSERGARGGVRALVAIPLGFALTLGMNWAIAMSGTSGRSRDFAAAMFLAAMATVVDAVLMVVVTGAARESLTPTALGPSCLAPPARLGRRTQPLSPILVPEVVLAALADIERQIRTDRAAADSLIMKLGAFLRLITEMVSLPRAPIDREIELACRYVELQEARRCARIRVDCAIDTEALSLTFPPTLLESLVDYALITSEFADQGTAVRIGVSAMTDHVILTVETAMPPDQSSSPLEMTSSLNRLVTGIAGAQLSVTAEGTNRCVTLRYPRS